MAEEDAPPGEQGTGTSTAYNPNNPTESEGDELLSTAADRSLLRGGSAKKMRACTKKQKEADETEEHTHTKSRVLDVNSNNDERKFPTNRVATTKYNLLTFFPRQALLVYQG